MGICFGHYLEVADVYDENRIGLYQFNHFVLGACMICMRVCTFRLEFSWIGIVKVSYFIAYFENLYNGNNFLWRCI